MIIVSSDCLCNWFNPAVIHQKYNVKYVCIFDMGQIKIQLTRHFKKYQIIVGESIIRHSGLTQKNI